MKANELQAGDLVLHRGKVRRVVYIYCRPLPDGTLPANEIGFSADTDEWVNADEAEPIPLSEQFFADNGWTCTENICYTRYTLQIPVEKRSVRAHSIRTITATFIQKLNGSKQLLMSIRGVKNRAFTGELDYVHELQQELRRCQHPQVAAALHVDERS